MTLKIRVFCVYTARGMGFKIKSTESFRRPGKIVITLAKKRFVFKC